MSKLISAITITAFIMAVLAISAFGSNVDNETIFAPKNGTETAVSTSTADKPNKPSDPIKATYIQQHYEPQYTYINRIPEDAQPIEVPEEEITTVAKMMYGECGSSWIPKVEKAACVWVVCNRVDSDDPYFPDTIEEVVKQSGGFYGYNKANPIVPELYDIAKDVLTRYYSEYDGMPYNSGRVLPKDYLWFTGDGTHNYFRNAYKSPYNTWDWSLDSPYED